MLKELKIWSQTTPSQKSSKKITNIKFQMDLINKSNIRWDSEQNRLKFLH